MNDELKGTTNCPICGRGFPHNHHPLIVEAWKERNFANIFQQIQYGLMNRVERDEEFQRKLFAPHEREWFKALSREWATDFASMDLQVIWGTAHSGEELLSRARSDEFWELLRSWDREKPRQTIGELQRRVCYFLGQKTGEPNSPEEPAP